MNTKEPGLWKNVLGNGEARKAFCSRIASILMTTCCVLLLIGITAYALSENSKTTYGDILTQIKEYCLQDKEISKGDLEKQYAQLTKKEKSEQIMLAEEYFILGYAEYYKFEDEKATRHFEKAIATSYSGTDTFVKIASGLFWKHLHMEEVDAAQAVAYEEQILSALTVSEWNEEIDTAATYLNVMMNDSQERTASIAILSDLLDRNPKLTEEASLNLYNILAVLYGASGNYAKAIEESLRVVEQSEACENTYFLAKATADMGAVYNALGNYEKALTQLRKSLSYEIPDEKEDAFLKSYALTNICEAYLAQGNYVDIAETKKKIMQYCERLPKEEVAGFELCLRLFETEYYIQNGNMKQAKKCLDAAKLRAPLAADSTTVNIEILYRITEADYMCTTGKCNKAYYLYKEALRASDEDAYYKKMVLEKMIRLSEQEKKYKTTIDYYKELAELYKNTSEENNNDYAEYAIQKHKNELALIRANRSNTYKVIWIAALIGMFMIILVILLMYVMHLEILNRTDGLTQCYNRKFLDRELMKEAHWKEKTQSKNHVMILDIDDFKKINDVYGHLYGDAVLQKVAELVKAVVDKRGMIFRYGGEEFVVLTMQLTQEQMITMAEEIRVCIERYSWVENRNITVSIGVASAEELTEKDGRQLIALADKRLYDAKENGKNRVSAGNGHSR